MNLTFSTISVPEYGSYRIYHVDSNSSLSDIDDALYYFEGPYYRYAASGAGCDPSQCYPGWNCERQRLTQLWLSKHTIIHTKPKELGLWDSIKAMFK